MLLQGMARQESRLNTTVRSPAGAVGLLQLMPATAQELAGTKLTDMELEEASLNSQLGARYLKQILVASKGNIFLAVAGYNAGPGAAGSWLNKTLQQIPELWVEAIPYPETRIYVKNVLGGKFSYEQLNRFK
jgi:soluble lytic murein transglycosylase